MVKILWFFCEGSRGNARANGGSDHVRAGWVTAKGPIFPGAQTSIFSMSNLINFTSLGFSILPSLNNYLFGRSFTTTLISSSLEKIENWNKVSCPFKIPIPLPISLFYGLCQFFHNNNGPKLKIIRSSISSISHLSLIGYLKKKITH